MQTEVIPWGTTPLVRDGVLTESIKRLPRSGDGQRIAFATPREELEYAAGNPAFQLHDFNFTDDIRLVAREEGLISVNNALAIHFTGQVGSESISYHMYTGTGGQTAFGIASSLAGGKSIIVLPSRATVRGAAGVAYHSNARIWHGSNLVADLRPLCRNRIRNRQASRKIAPRARERSESRSLIRILPQRTSSRSKAHVREQPFLFPVRVDRPVCESV